MSAPKENTRHDTTRHTGKAQNAPPPRPTTRLLRAAVGVVGPVEAHEEPSVDGLAPACSAAVVNGNARRATARVPDDVLDRHIRRELGPVLDVGRLAG